MATMALQGTSGRPGAPHSWDGTGNDPELQKLTESPTFSRNDYLCSAQSKIRGMWKEDIGGTWCFPAHKVRL